ncbi:MAG: lipoate--protein ligase [Alkalispirochaetaceae bacterium]
MENEIRVLRSEITNPWFNLATEDWIFRELDPRQHVLFLWRNADTVVIGRHQNPWKECKVQKMEEDDVYLARRQSGGGAVFHDLGNSNFTFLSAKERYNQEDNFRIIINALGRLGIPAEKSGRNDILVKGRKVSGSAFKHTKERSFHHGTLLIDADLTRLQDYLNPRKAKLISKGIDSVRSRVANLNEYVPGLNHDQICEAVMEAFFDYHRSRCEVEHLDYETLASIPSLNEYFEQMKAWEWRFGNTPDFNHSMETRFDWGNMDLYIDAKRGRIEKAKIYSDSLFPEMVDALMAELPGHRYDPEEVKEAVIGVADLFPEQRRELEEFGFWLAGAL